MSASGGCGSPLLQVKAIATALALTAAFGLAACGGDDEPSSSGQATTADTRPSEPAGTPNGDPAGKQAAEARPAVPKSRDSGREGPAETGDRYDPGADDGKIRGDGSIQRFGEVADDGEAQEAIAVAVGYYDARAAHDWDRACDLLSVGMKRQLEQLSGQAAEKTDCRTAIAALTAGVPRRLLLEQARSIRFMGFRVEGDGGYALFVSDVIPHGFVPMHRDEDGWRVAALAGSSL